jgi:electron transport complex protein RnfD
MVPVMVILVAVGSALFTEFLFSILFGGKTDSLSDCSAIVTGTLLAFTLGPFTPLYIVAFGGSMAVLFGKLLWGGVGRNRFNPALIGREFMTIFFPTVMTSSAIWYDRTAVNLQAINLFDGDLLNQLLFKPSGAIGEYSLLLLTLGGLYLLFRRRISWHIPLSLLTVFTLSLLIFSGSGLSFSLGGLLLGAIFMATDMPSSPTTHGGRLFYGAMIGLTAILFIRNGIRFEYMSYSILLLNAFAHPITRLFRPRGWGRQLELLSRLGQVISLTIILLISTFALIYLHHAGAIKYLLFAYIALSLLRFIDQDIRKTNS